ncbi:hypothetical protein C900_04184 [Fulvivirga imtechensis AK7]|uniref:Secretion system C-terminal sorting domain-containing protein n=1 Tax=Fulvivirga imtechensis AK7 TaxID=1237149 RepID=L8K1K7_9BACT|nr:T9SS type A sorting domain-containing protein [Fulvivirga imtechensis]ELR73332.1 hypothetical protein C900_04184 [Fulvivirga imtechensis AK7]
MKPYIYIFLPLYYLMIYSVSAQFDYPEIEDYGPAKEFLLGYPDQSEGIQFIPIGIDLWEGDEVNTIYFGQIPENAANKPVIVFVHGYATNAQVWLKGDDNMYWDVYRDGYRSAYVSLTPNRHMWTNGHMLARMIDRITGYYGVEQVVLVGWSKGGIDIDAALVHAGANSKVSQVFTLNAPHYGTGIAELANSILLSLVNIIFMQNNDATLCLQRGYMNYFRSLTDNHVNNTVSYTTLGAWGNGPLNRLAIPQGYLYLAGGSKASGGNDGVVPYSSSRRPGGNELYGGQRKAYFLGIPYYTGPDETNLDHYELTRGGLVWPHIKANLSPTISGTQITPEGYNPNSIVNSRLQIVQNNKFYIEEEAGKVAIFMAKAENTEEMIVKNAEGKAIVFRSSSIANRGDGRHIIYEYEGLSSGEYTFKTKRENNAIVLTEGGMQLQLRTGLSHDKLVYTAGEAIPLTIKIQSANGESINKAQVTGTMIRSTDLQLNKTNDAPHIISFENTGNEFRAEVIENLPPGIYNILVNAQGANFRKHVITSIAVAGGSGHSISEGNQESSLDAAYPNPFRQSINIDLTVTGKGAKLVIYNIFGQQVKAFDLTGRSGRIRLLWDAAAENTEKGMYILQLTDGRKKITQKAIMR